MPDIAFVERRPTVGEHGSLTERVGWDDHFDGREVRPSLSHSLHSVVAVSSGRAIGMGRVVGDGAHYFYLQDIVVHPDFRDAGVASTIVSMLLDWIAETAPAPAFVGLFASDEAVGLYESHGFGTTSMTGMHRVVEPRTAPRA